MWALAENSDRAAVPDGMDVPTEIARGEDRLSVIAQAKAKIEQSAIEQQEFEAKTAKRQAQRKAGKKPLSKDPEPRQPTQMSESNGDASKSSPFYRLLWEQVRQAARPP